MVFICPSISSALPRCQYVTPRMLFSCSLSSCVTDGTQTIKNDSQLFTLNQWNFKSPMEIQLFRLYCMYGFYPKMIFSLPFSIFNTEPVNLSREKRHGRDKNLWRTPRQDARSFVTIIIPYTWFSSVTIMRRGPGLSLEGRDRGIPPLEGRKIEIPPLANCNPSPWLNRKFYFILFYFIHIQCGTYVPILRRVGDDGSLPLPSFLSNLFIILSLLDPNFFEKLGPIKLLPSVCLSVCPSVSHAEFLVTTRYFFLIFCMKLGVYKW